MVGQITGKMFDHPMKKDCVSDLSGPASCRTGKCCNSKFSSNAMVKSAHNFCDSIDICGYFRAVILNICTLGGLVLIFSQSIVKMSVEAFICASTCENISMLEFLLTLA